MDTPAPLPVTLLTGFLGSGKTTLLNTLVRRSPRTAIIMNEFGEVGLDHQLLERTEGPIALLSGGCVCCTVVNSLSPTLKNLWMARSKGEIPAFERVVIETTGIADPVPILDALLNDPWVRARFRLDGVVTTIDAALGEQQLDSYFEAVRQVAVADRLILTKTDLRPPDQTATLQARLQALNPAAEIMKVIKGDLDPARLFNLGLYNMETRSPEVRRWLNEARYKPARAEALGRTSPGPVQDNHDQRIQAFSVIVDEPIARSGLQAALTMLISFRSEYLLRFKAIVNVRGEDRPVVLHGVQHVLYPEVSLDSWPDTDRRSQFVFIVRDLEPPFVAKVLQDFTQAARGSL